MQARAGLLLGAGVTLAFVPNVTGTAVLTGWPFLALLLPFLIRERARTSLPGWLGLAFIGWAGLSLLWTENLYDGLNAVAQWIILGMAFYIGATTLEPRFIYLGLCIGISVSVALALAQAFGFDGISQQGGYHSHPAGLFINSTVFGTIVALVLTLSLFSGIYWFAPIGILGLFLSGARGPALACFAICLWGFWRHWSKGFAVIILVPALLVGAGMYLNKGGAKDAAGSLQQRTAYWVDTAENLSWEGAGAGSFVSQYPIFAKRTNLLERRPEYVYSDPLQLVFEYGVGSLLLFAALILLLEVPLEAERLTLLVFLISSLAFPALAIPVAAFIAAFVAGRLALGWSRIRAGEHLGRPTVPPWVDGSGYVIFGDGRVAVSAQSSDPQWTCPHGDVPAPIRENGPSSWRGAGARSARLGPSTRADCA